MPAQELGDIDNGRAAPAHDIQAHSTRYTLAAATQEFKIVAVLEDYYDANHNLTCAIRVNGGTASINPGSVLDEELAPPLDPTDAHHKPR